MSRTDNTHGDERNSFDDLEERIEALEVENERLKGQLNEYQEEGLTVSRRQALAGLAGGSAFFGITGFGSAQRNDDSDPFADKNHDHSGDYLGKRDSVDRVDVGSVNTAQFNGARMLSSFDTLQAALNYSNANTAAIIIDGEYTTDETNVSVPKRSILVGWPEYSKITATASDSNPLFAIEETGNRHYMYWQGFRAVNEGDVGAFLKSQYGNWTGDFIPSRSHLADLQIIGFGGTYTIDIDDAYGATFSNIHVKEFANGAYSLTNCNASRFLQLTAVEGGDGETPALYIANCYGTLFQSPYMEFAKTDAVIQVSTRSRIVLINPYLEARSEAYCGIQIGDGGLTKGNTNGNANGSSVWMLGGVMRGFANSETDAVRILNSKNTRISGLAAAKFTNGFNVEGSTTDSGNALTTDVSATVVDGFQTWRVENLVNPGSGTGFLYKSGRETTSAPEVSDMATKEVQRGKGTGPNGEDEFFYKATPDRISRFTATETISTKDSTE